MWERNPDVYSRKNLLSSSAKDSKVNPFAALRNAVKISDIFEDR
jgi:hypothetical protein